MRRNHPFEPITLYPSLSVQLPRSARNPITFLLVMFGVMLEGKTFQLNLLE